MTSQLSCSRTSSKVSVSSLVAMVVAKDDIIAHVCKGSTTLDHRSACQDPGPYIKTLEPLSSD